MLQKCCPERSRAEVLGDRSKIGRTPCLPFLHVRIIVLILLLWLVRINIARTQILAVPKT